MSEVRTAISSAVSAAARPPERTHAPVCTCLRTDVSQTCRVEAGEPPAMMLVGLAEHNQPQRESEPDLGPSITSLAANKLLPPARSTACTRLLSAVCLHLTSLPPPTSPHTAAAAFSALTAAPPLDILPSTRQYQYIPARNHLPNLHQRSGGRARPAPFSPARQLASRLAIHRPHSFTTRHHRLRLITSNGFE